MTSQEANLIPLENILSYYGHNPSRHFGGYDMYSSPFRRDSSPSFKVFKDENRWYDFGEGTHGRAVDLVMRIENCSFPEAMRRIGEMGLTGQAGATSGQTSVREKKALSGSSMKILGTVPLQNRHLLEYAASRGIDADVIRKYCVEVHYCFEKRGSNCGTACSRGVPMPRTLPALQKATVPVPFSKVSLTCSASSSMQRTILNCRH